MLVCSCEFHARRFAEVLDACVRSTRPIIRTGRSKILHEQVISHTNLPAFCYFCMCEYSWIICIRYIALWYQFVSYIILMLLAHQYLHVLINVLLYGSFTYDWLSDNPGYAVSVGANAFCSNNVAYTIMFSPAIVIQLHFIIKYIYRLALIIKV